jgi:hypothetical protein
MTQSDIDAATQWNPDAEFEALFAKASIRTRNSLKNDCIDTLPKLLAKTPEELLQPNVGRKSVAEIERILAERGLYLAGVAPPAPDVRAAVEALFRLLPPPGSVWLQSQRGPWVAALIAVLDLAYTNTKSPRAGNGTAHDEDAGPG